MIRTICLLFSLLFIISCQKEENTNIDTIIKKYNKTDFSFFKNTFIGIRERNRNEITYIIEKSEGNLPVYFVRYSLNNEKIVKIDRTALERESVKDYFTDTKIFEIIKNFRKFNLSLLEVDEENNVFMNYSKINDPAILLRLAIFSDKKEIRKGYIYKHYEDNWYVRK
jgi:hypothetical protein